MWGGAAIAAKPEGGGQAAVAGAAAGGGRGAAAVAAGGGGRKDIAAPSQLNAEGAAGRRVASRGAQGTGGGRAAL